MRLLITADGTAHYRNKVYAATIGRTGIIKKKKEGDGASPAGNFQLCKVFYRADRILPPITGLELAKIKNTDGWCDAPEDHNYNSLVASPYHASYEALYRSDSAYDIVVETDYNTDPVISGAGSAIFVHLTKGDKSQNTEGCIAFSEPDLREILRLWQPNNDRLVIEFTHEHQK
ncbi:MAG: L,D-transpeptidase family protein [Pseudomonadota bacterium]|nr:L,D-transpeptidase family protein [Pseudomonadota bacterium]